MLQAFESNIAKNHLFNKTNKLLLAVSGGVDSVVLAHLLKRSGYDFTLAHCNFNLRGKDSEQDEKFCRALAKKLEVGIFVARPAVKKYCKENGVSVQMAAREQRYEWFDTLLKNENFDFILTAHHANDLVETVLINLLRGTGIAGLKGIPVKNGNTVRPLLAFTREQIESFAKKEKIKFRTDKSNLEDKYERNYLRLKVIPELKKINPSLEQTFLKNGKRFANDALIVKDYTYQRMQSLITEKNGLIKVDRNKLAQEKYPETFLHYWLSPLGFSESQQQNILRVTQSNATEGKQFVSTQYTLIVGRNDLQLAARKKNRKNEIEITSAADLKKQNYFLVSEEKKFVQPGKNELIITEKDLVFPLTVRRPKTGEKFRPFGMKGFKLLSDFIKDEKIDSFDKQNINLLVNGNGEIIWVIGYRSDERYRVDPSEKKFLKLSVK